MHNYFELTFTEIVFSVKCSINIIKKYFFKKTHKYFSKNKIENISMFF